MVRSGVKTWNQFATEAGNRCKQEKYQRHVVMIKKKYLQDEFNIFSNGN